MHIMKCLFAYLLACLWTSHAVLRKCRSHSQRISANRVRRLNARIKNGYSSDFEVTVTLRLRLCWGVRLKDYIRWCWGKT